ncbi:MAG: hypothetical protein NTW49_10770 [Bacteroidia bacterium]|nr:hypothetical protein [Bacteroidia bacterium]
MKKIIVSLTAFLFIICCTNTVQSQTVTVGSTISYNTGTQIPTAYSRQYASTHQQILVLASELISAGAPVGGNITSIAFDVVAINNSSPLPGYTIKMKQTSSTWISTFSNTGLTQVKTYASYSVSTGWNTHTFSTSFQWDGFSNIIIDICNSITTPSATNPNASIYINDPGFTSYVIGVDNTVNQCGASTVSTYTYERPTVRFSISANLPSCANLTAPADNAISLPINTTLSWTNGGNATSYDVYFGTNPTSPFIINQTSLTYNTGMLSEFTTYYWKIVARNSNGTANGCTTRTFTTGSACPATYTPPDSTINALTYQNLSWSSVPYTTYYYLYFGTSPDPPFYDSTSNTSYNIVDLLSNTTYYWKIVPKNPTGFGTGCSTISFTTRHTDHWFVKSDGNNTASGNCWNNAVQDLSALLFNVAVGDTVHIAAGTYLPTRDNNNNTSPTDVRTYCFHLIQGVKLLGGYPATANGNNLSTSLSVTRDPYSNLTIMSGNIGPGDSLDNCYHVVWAISGNGGPSLVDGFKITLGYASGTETTDYNGGGIYAINCSLVIQNSILERNYCHSYILGSGHGGAIYSYNCNLTISHCTLTLNGSTIDANAIYAAFGSLELISSTISNHSGYLSTLYVTSATLSIDNCTFWNNNNSTDIQIYNSTNYLLRISNSTISQLVNNGGAQLYLYNSLIYNYIPGIPNNIRNSILNSGSSSTYYDDNGTTTTGLPGMSNWISNLSDNGGHSKTCMLTVYNFQNPAVGKGNPAYAGLTDQRGVVRANPPCVGAVEVPYAIASNILINDTTIYAGSAVTLTAQSSTISSPVFEWYSDLALTTHVFTGSSFTTPVLNSNYFYYITVHNSTVFPNPQPFAKKVTIYVTMLPIITLQPVAIVKCLGDSAGFSVGSYGSGLSYQWVKNSNEITGQTSNILNLNNIQYQDSGYYFCKVTNAYGTTNSNSVQLNVHTVPGTANPITGYSEICPGLNGLQYNTSPITDVNSYTWTFPSGVTGSGNTVSIPVNFSSSAQSGNITVSGSNQCGNGTPSSFSVTVGNYPPSQPGLITGDTIMCQGQTNVAYQITSLPVLPEAAQPTALV